MRYAEKNCTNISRHAVDPWSPKVRDLARDIRYLTVQIKHTLRDTLQISLVDCMDKLNRLYIKLSAKRKAYREYIKNAAAHRALHIDERAQFHVP